MCCKIESVVRSWKILVGAVCTAALIGCQKPTQEDVVIRPEKTVILQPEGSDSSTHTGAESTSPPVDSASSPTADSALEMEASQTSKSSGEIVLGGKYHVTVPSGWRRRPPAVAMIEYEFIVPAVSGDPRDARATFMAAGGSVEANIERWINQFAPREGTDMSSQAKRETLDIAGTRVHLVDISGTYLESSGLMMGNPIPRENYRMLGAVIESQDSLNYFIKFYGPEKTVAANAEAFRKMIESLRL